MFCNHCGAKLEAGQPSCPSCGKAVVTVSVPTAEGRLVRHLRLLAVFWIVLSVFRLLGATACLIVGNIVFRSVRLPAPVGDFLPALMALIGGCLLVLALAGLAAGWGLLQQLPWARLLSLIVAIVSLLDIPFGTALGIYTLWVLLPAEAEEEFARIARPA